jgi:microcystin-dependent protein
MADYVIGSPALFNEDAQFFKDVYIYSKLYCGDFTGSNAKLNNLNVEGTLNVYGKSNFYNDVYIIESASVGILTVRNRLDVGIGGTILTTSTGNIGISVTLPRQTLDVLGTAIVSNKIGIGNTNPKKELDVTGIALVSNRVGIGSTEPEQRLDISGSVKIDEFIYDSVNSPGANGYYLSMDEEGIRWTIIDNSPAGTVITYANTTAPTGYIKANGASLSTTTYATLFAAIGYTFGGSGGSFNVPDLRGEFIRGWDDVRGVDSGRSFGSSQAEMIKQHKHWVSGAAYDDGNMSTSGSSNTQDYGLAADAGSYSVDDPNKNFGRFTRNDPGFGTNNETRPRNIALLSCIKY